MKDLAKNILNGEKTDLTPIEIILGIDEEGRTTARKLYEFLELDVSNYSKWTKRKILDNEFAVENIDFIPFVLNDERNPKPTTDYKLSASFAKKLAMGTHNEKGEAAKNYFIKVEDKLKELATQSPLIKQLSPMEQLKLQYQVLENHEQKIDNAIERIDKIENNTTIDYSQQQELNDLANKKVVAILGGKDTAAYRELAKKAFRSFWHDYKNKLNVNSYRNTLIKDFEAAKQAIINWKPNRELELMIKGCNSPS